MALVERGGRARTFHVTNVTAKMLRKVVVPNVRRSSELMTDGHRAYPRIGRDLVRRGVVNHETGEYVRGADHANTVESFFAILKRGIYGNYHCVSEAHLQRHLAEFDFRYNNREALGVDDTTRTNEALKGSTGKRLTYRRTGQTAHA